MKFFRSHFLTATIAFSLGLIICFGSIVNRTGLPLPKKAPELPDSLIKRAKTHLAEYSERHPAMHISIRSSPTMLRIIGSGPVSESAAFENQMRILLQSGVPAPGIEYESGTYSDKTVLFIYQWGK